MNGLNARDVLQNAVNIEDNGHAFYEYAAGIANDKEAKETYEMPAKEELKHKEKFNSMKKDTGDDPGVQAVDEYPGYLIEYFGKKSIFSMEDFNEKSKNRGFDTRDYALDYAIEKESESIAYYNEIYGFAGEKHKEIIAEIIEEERRHFSRLSGIKSKIQKKKKK